MILCALYKKRQKEHAIEWFNNNHVIVKPDKLPAIFLSTTDNSVSCKLNVHYNNNLIPGRDTGG